MICDAIFIIFSAVFDGLRLVLTTLSWTNALAVYSASVALEISKLFSYSSFFSKHKL